MKPLATIILTAVVLAVAIWAFLQFAPHDGEPEQPDGVKLKLKLQNVKGRPKLIQQDGGTFRYELKMADGRTVSMTPEEFTRTLYEDRTMRTWWSRLMNISTTAGIVWVGIGLFGQLLFTGRMVVQWLVSEKRKRSVVPVSFWWMSLIGASMLMIYFIWRQDVVGVLGQGTGWLIYTRNLWLIHRPRSAERIAADPGPEPGTPPSHAHADERELV